MGLHQAGFFQYFYLQGKKNPCPIINALSQKRTSNRLTHNQDPGTRNVVIKVEPKR